ncbi:N-6 DNA methylase [Rhodoferax sp.]|uniref:N-6 DNA methylase n=1 Tax=Rhodoferax sp. TaxID=50421 RepID=UPI00276B2513|nr:N-6 DNA methylase [Rhodoferax sp.]
MSSTALAELNKIEASLWEAADQLRANSKLTSTEYCMPVLGVIFLRHASNRYDDALAAIQADQEAGRSPKRKLVAADFKRRRALMLPPQAHYRHLMDVASSPNIGKALVGAMHAIEADFEPLLNQLPKEYDQFDARLLEDLLRAFDTAALRRASGDVFGRIYEYFLMKFAMQGAQDNGEFFTPPSLVQMIVNLIEPDHGVVADLACGSGGMFVQSSHFIEHEGLDTMKRVTFYGQEKTPSTIRLAKMNLAVHGLEGDIRAANTFYEDEHRLPDSKPLWGHCDFMMANPPFNVDMVDATRVKDDRRLPFGLPGVNKAGKVGNANYLWISYFHSYLSPTGRAGFVMSSQASSAGHGEAEVRRKPVQTGAVDVMVAIRPNFFYTRTVPCELWFYDRGKPAERRDTVLMLDARQVFRKVTRKIYDFSPEQLADLTAVVWLYRGQHERFEALVAQHLGHAVQVAQACWRDEEAAPACEPLEDFARAWQALRTLMRPYVALLPADGEHSAVLADCTAASTDPLAPIESLRQATDELVAQHAKAAPSIAGSTTFHRDSLLSFADQVRALSIQLDHATRATLRLLDLAEKQLAAQADAAWPTREIGRARKALEAARGVAVEHLKWVRHFQRHAAWLIERFPEARYRDVQGLCKAVTRAEIEAADWSLTPGRYVGVAAVVEEEDFDFIEAMRSIRSELAALDNDATRLAVAIQSKLMEIAA